MNDLATHSNSNFTFNFKVRKIHGLTCISYHIQQLGLPAYLLEDDMQMVRDLSTKAGEYLYKLHVNKPSQDEVRALMKIFSESLSYVDDTGRLRIHSAAWDNKSISFVPFVSDDLG